MRLRHLSALPLLAIASACLGLLSGPSLAAGNFSQHAGFAAYFSAHPPAHKPADNHDRALLRRYRPRLWIGPHQDAPIAFYRDYIAHGTLYNGHGKIISHHVNHALLNRYKQDPSVVFRHQPAPPAGRPVVFARIEHSKLACTPGFTFLTYNFVFRNSGLPAGLAGWKAWPLALLANLDDWHQLDHYTAASVVLNAAQRPIALLLQQHNDERSYILGTDLKRPADGRVKLIAALRSNELYPWQPGRQHHRTVEYMTPANLRYLVTGRQRSFFSADDITEAAHQVHYGLAYLPPDDAFYTFQGSLGAQRLLPGRSGPPGADFHVSPMFMNPALQLIAFHWQPGNSRQMQSLSVFLHASHAAGHAATHGRAFQALCRHFMQALHSASTRSNSSARAQ